MYPVSDVSDTDAGAIHVRYAPDTPAGVSEYSDNFDTSRYAPIRLWYASDTSMIFFSRYFDGFGQEYTPDTRRYALILVDMPRYSSDTSLSEIYIMSFVLL
jgi:hypothetical protein